MSVYLLLFCMVTTLLLPTHSRAAGACDSIKSNTQGYTDCVNSYNTCESVHSGESTNYCQQTAEYIGNGTNTYDSCVQSGGSASSCGSNIASQAIYNYTTTPGTQAPPASNIACTPNVGMISTSCPSGCSSNDGSSCYLNPGQSVSCPSGDVPYTNASNGQESCGYVPQSWQNFGSCATAGQTMYIDIYASNSQGTCGTPIGDTSGSNTSGTGASTPTQTTTGGTGSGTNNTTGSTPCTGTNCASNGNITYTPLEPIPGMTYSTSNISFSQVVGWILRALISIGGMVAVVSLVLGGVAYMVSSVGVNISKAKAQMQSAIYGLLLLIACWLILNTINPQLIKFNIMNSTTGLPTTNSANSSSASTQTNTTTVPSSGSAVTTK